jgi:hypothetical protein
MAFALLVASLPAASTAAASEGITVETPAGPVTCAPDPANEPGPEAISATPFAHGERIVISETGALRCQTSTFGELEVTGTGLPWQATLNERALSAHLKGSPHPGLLVRPVGIPLLSCTYQVGQVRGTLTPGSSPSVSLSVNRVRLNKHVRNIAFCPALGPLNFDVTLP